MNDGPFSSVQTVSGEEVPLLGKITVPLHLNGRQFPCEIHVVQNLAYDAILGRDFLQENRARSIFCHCTFSADKTLKMLTICSIYLWRSELVQGQGIFCS